MSAYVISLIKILGSDLWDWPNIPLGTVSN